MRTQRSRRVLRLDSAPLIPILPDGNRVRTLRTTSATLRRQISEGVEYRTAVRWCAILGVDPHDVWPDFPSPEEAVTRRFWSNVDKSSGECWLWCGDVDDDGYGVFCKPGQQRIGAHTFALEQELGARPAGADTCHSCDNPPCVRPSHLFFGSRLENVHDAISKNRHPRGSTNGRAIVNEAQILDIRHRFERGETAPALAVEFGVTSGAISAITHGRNWRHVGGPISTAGPGRRPRKAS